MPAFELSNSHNPVEQSLLYPVISLNPCVDALDCALILLVINRKQLQNGPAVRTAANEAARGIKTELPHQQLLQPSGMLLPDWGCSRCKA